MLTRDGVVGDYTLDSDCTPEERGRIIDTLISLHTAKKYKQATFYCAVGICDRYLRRRADQKFAGRWDDYATLATVCLLMAAKLEQPMSPDFNMMIWALPQPLRKFVSKPELLDLEENIIRTLDFDVQQVGPLLFAERFLQVIGLNGTTSECVLKCCDEICKYLARKAHIYLVHSSSIVAAVAVTLALAVCSDRNLAKTLSAFYLPELKQLNKSSDFNIWWS